jgi:hypothetical protein
MYILDSYLESSFLFSITTGFRFGSSLSTVGLLDLKSYLLFTGDASLENCKRLDLIPLLFP